MPDNSDPQQIRARAIDRLATLQSMKEQARAGKRPDMLKTIERMIEQEMKALRASQERHSKPT